jgi:hypothetical protein
MKILLDECVPWPLHKILAGHACEPVQRRGWAGIKNGELLRLAEADFEAFITSDQSLRYQQNLTGFRIAILQLSTNKLKPIVAAAATVQAAVASRLPPWPASQSSSRRFTKTSSSNTRACA